MDLLACFFDADGMFTLGACKPFGLGLADLAKLIGISLIALLTWFLRSIIMPIATWPFKYAASRKTTANWPRISNEHGHVDREMIGRQGTLVRLREILVEGNPAAITNNRKGIAAVRGYGGVGKTFTAYNYLARYRSRYEIIWLISAETLDGLHEGLVQLGQRLGQVFDPATDLKSRALQTLHAASKLGKPILILFDNVVSPRDIQSYLIEPGRIHYLITSRHDDWNGVAQDFPLGLLDLSAAIALLKSEADRNDLDFGKLAEDLGRLPLALVIAGAYLRENHGISIEEYRSSLAQRLQDAPTNVEYDKSVFASVIASYERVGQEAQSLANFCAFLAPDDIDPEFIRNVAPHIGANSIETIAVDRNVLSQTFTRLRNAAILEKIERTSAAVHSMHRLTAAVIRHQLSNEGSFGYWATAATKSLLSVMPRNSMSRPEVWPYCVRPLAHVASLVESGPPNTEEGKKSFVQLLLRASEYLEARGDFATAVKYLRVCQPLTDDVFGKKSVPYGGILNRLGGLFLQTGQFDAAEEAETQALAIAREFASGDDLNVATALMSLAQIYWKRGELEKAEPLVIESRDITIRITGKDSHKTATAGSNLASLYSALGKFDEAIELTERAVASTKGAVGIIHPGMAVLYINLAGNYGYKGNWDLAVSYSLRALAIHVLLKLEDHPNTDSMLISLTNILTNAGRTSELKLMRDNFSQLIEPTIKLIRQEHDEYIAAQSEKVES